MIFNNADNIMYGEKEVDRVFYGKNLVWERGNFYWISDRQTQSICGYKGVPTSPVCYLNWNQKPTNVSRPFPSYKLNTNPYKLKNIFGDIYDYKYLTTVSFDKAYSYSLVSTNQHRDVFAKTNLVVNYNNLEDKSYCTEIGDEVFLYGEVNNIIFKNCTINSIGHSAFANFTSYTYGELMIGDSNNSITIKDQAFWYCHWEFKISFNNEQINLGRYVFAYSYVKEVVFPSQVSSMAITNSTFKGCEKLKKINLPVGITSIGDEAFDRCLLLEDIAIPNTVTKIGHYAFNKCESFKSIIIPDSITSIGYWTFANCSNLISVTFLNGVTEVGHEMFYGCTSLIHVELPLSIKQIGQQAFDGCSSLTNIEIPSGVKTIWNNAFQNCISLTEIIIPYGVTEIHSRLFYGCSNLSSVVFPSSISKIGIGIVGKCSDVLDIYYTGTKEQWNTIEKDRYWLDDISGEVNIHYNYNN